MTNQNSAVQDSLIEKGVLASIFDDVDMIDVISKLLRPEDFSEPRNEIIYSTILDFYQKNEKFDVIKVAARLGDTGELSTVVGGIQYFYELIDPDTIFSNTDPVGYALLVQERSLRRAISMFGKGVDEKTMPGSGYSGDETLSFAQSELSRISQMARSQSELQHASELVEDFFAEIEYNASLDGSMPIGVPSGFVDLDNLTTGFKKGQMIILGGRPAMGKTTVALDFVRSASLLAGKSVAFFSLEMGRNEVMMKIFSAHAHIEFSKIKKGNVSSEEWDILRAVREEVNQSSLYIDDTPNLSLVNLRSKCLELKSSPSGLDMIVIDYLQLMSVPGVSKSDGRQQAVSELSRGIKLLAKELEVPIVILSQLSREVEKRNDKTPMMSDLRESGSLEQDADIIMFVHRPEYYDANDRPGQALIVVAKHRGGATDNIMLIPLLEYSKFANGAGKFAAEPPADPETTPPDEDDPFGSVEVPTPPAGYDDVYPDYSEEAPSGPDSGGDAW